MEAPLYCFNAWIKLYDSEEDELLGVFEAKITQLRELLKGAAFKFYPADPIMAVNHSTVLLMACDHNHDPNNAHHESLLTVLRWIAKHLPLSHGLVYWQNDEIEINGNRIHNPYDGYWVLVIAKGQVMIRGDPFLSPRVPVQED